MLRLRKSQQNALEYVDEANIKDYDEYKKDECKTRKQLDEQKMEEEEIHKVFKEVPIHVNFPSNLFSTIAKDGYYRNQFETKNSRGTYNPSCRNSWESRLFNKSYLGSTGFVKPKYGNLQVNHKNKRKLNRRVTQYGYSYLILKNKIKKRTTFTIGDSSGWHVKPISFKHSHLIRRYLHKEDISYFIKNKRFDSERLLEAQIHGSIKLDRDVEAIYLPEDWFLANIKHVKKLRKKGVKVRSYK